MLHLASDAKNSRSSFFKKSLLSSLIVGALMPGVSGAGVLGVQLVQWQIR